MGSHQKSKQGQSYLTLVYQIGGGLKRLLAVVESRTEESLRGALGSLGAETRTGVQFVCSDMWKPYLKVIREQLGEAVHVLDRFHIMQHDSCSNRGRRWTRSARRSRSS